MSWQKSGVAAGDLPEGTIRGVVVADRPVVLVREGSAIYALDGTCPHIGGELADGALELGKIVCPLHGATFEVATGAVRADPFGVAPPEGAVGPLPSYPVRVVDGAIEIDAPAP